MSTTLADLVAMLPLPTLPPDVPADFFAALYPHPASSHAPGKTHHHPPGRTIRSLPRPPVTIDPNRLGTERCVRRARRRCGWPPVHYTSAASMHYGPWLRASLTHELTSTVPIHIMKLLDRWFW